MDRQIGIISFNIRNSGLSADDIGNILDEEFGIAVRTGYHCAPYVHKHLKNEGYGGVMRISIGRYTTADDIERLVKAVREIVGG